MLFLPSLKSFLKNISHFNAFNKSKAIKPFFGIEVNGSKNRSLIH